MRTTFTFYINVDSLMKQGGSFNNHYHFEALMHTEVVNPQ